MESTITLTSNPYGVLDVVPEFVEVALLIRTVKSRHNEELHVIAEIFKVDEARREGYLLGL
jgi:hypothetical protein